MKNKIPKKIEKSINEFISESNKMFGNRIKKMKIKLTKCFYEKFY